MMSSVATLLLFASPLFASPLSTFLQERAPSFEWTAWGDSYASGVGAGKYVDGRRCLRYQNAYPEIIQDDPDKLLPGSGGKFNNVVCSGAKAEEVEAYQFYEKAPYFGKPDPQYYPRPASGNPTMGTLTVGGDDIDFPGILNNCIIEGFPFPLNQGFKDRTCDEQRALSWKLISGQTDHSVPNPNLVKKFDSVIKKTVQWGKSHTGGNNFRLYVTGYAQFFNQVDPACNKVTFARAAHPKDDGKPHTMLTTDLRKDFNDMTITLNAAIKQAVGLNKNDKVTFIDIDPLAETHRFCEPGANEPNQDNPNLYFFHYPYTKDTDNDKGIQYLNQVEANNVNSLTWDPSSTLYTDYVSQFWGKVNEADLCKAIGCKTEDDAVAQGFWDGTVGTVAKLFHPQLKFHHAIYQAIINQYKKDTAAPAPATTSTAAPQPTNTAAPPPYATGVCTLQLNEHEAACLSHDKDLTAEVTIFDAKDAQIGYTKPDSGGVFPGINAAGPLSVSSKLPKPVVIVGEHQGDYVQFNYAGNGWTSKTEKTDNANCYCESNSWNEDAVCGRFLVNPIRKMKCYFKC